MKNKHAILLMAVGAALISGALAQGEAPEAGQAADSSATLSVSPVGEALSKLPMYNATPAADAKYYIYLESASWCPPCRGEMPKLVKAYPDMKKAGVEIIIVGRDDTAKLAQEYLTTFKAPFPGVFAGEPGLEKALPGFVGAEYVPHAVFVDSRGNRIKEGNGYLALNWKKIIADYEALRLQQVQQAE